MILHSPTVKTINFYFSKELRHKALNMISQQHAPNFSRLSIIIMVITISSKLNKRSVKNHSKALCFVRDTTNYGYVRNVRLKCNYHANYSKCGDNFPIMKQTTVLQLLCKLFHFSSKLSQFLCKLFL